MGQGGRATLALGSHFEGHDYSPQLSLPGLSGQPIFVSRKLGRPNKSGDDGNGGDSVYSKTPAKVGLPLASRKLSLRTLF
jgi:hypothetical protein